MEGERIPQVDGLSDLRPIGRGGFGSVYSAEQVSLGRRVAVKVFSVTGSESKRMQREATALGSLSDIPHVVQVHHVTTTDDGRPAIVMALMERSLTGAAHWPDRSMDRSLKWLDQVAQALQAAHVRGTFHRDVKPENILLDRSGDAYLADFGISSLLHMSESTTTSLSVSPPYAPPERLTAQPDSGAAGDVYSLAATFYEVIWGAPPFGTIDQGGLHGLISRIVAGSPPCPPGMPASVHDVMRTAMAVEPGARYQSPAEFAAELRRSIDAVRSGPTAAAPDPLATVPSLTTAGPVTAQQGVDVTTATPIVAVTDGAGTTGTTTHQIKAGAVRTARRLGVLLVAALVVAVVAAGFSRWMTSKSMTAAQTAANVPAPPSTTPGAIDPDEIAVPAPDGEAAAALPDAVRGYKKSGPVTDGTVRVFSPDSPSQVAELAGTMNNCSRTFWALRWRSANSDVTVHAEPIYSVALDDPDTYGDDTLAALNAGRAAEAGYMSGFGCATPAFTFGEALRGNESNLVDVIYEYQLWEPAV